MPSKAHRKTPMPYATESCKGRHRVVNTLVDTQPLRGLATRYGTWGILLEDMRNRVAWFLGTKETQRGTSPYPAPA